MDKGDHDRAIADLDEAIRLNPKDAFLFAARGAAYAIKEQYDRAIADYDQAIKLNPRETGIALEIEASFLGGRGDVAQSGGLRQVAKAIIEDDVAIDETTFTAIVTEAAKAEYPGLPADVAFAKVFADPSETGVLLRRAHEHAKGFGVYTPTAVAPKDNPSSPRAPIAPEDAPLSKRAPTENAMMSMSPSVVGGVPAFHEGVNQTEMSQAYRELMAVAEKQHALSPTKSVPRSSPPL